MHELETPSAAPRPWYREPLVWMLWAIPGSAVLVGVVMLFVSISTYDGLVVDDYYKRGLEIGQRMDRDRQAAARSLAATVRFDTGEAASGAQTLQAQEALVDVTSQGWPTEEATIPALTMSHATRGGIDKHLRLRRVGTGRYQADLPRLEPGRWYLSLETGEWRLTGELNTPLSGSVTVNLATAASP